MSSKTILETDRLIFRDFSSTDADFILTLLNTPSWQKFIGDKNVHSTEDAEHYLINGPLKSYLENGFGLWLVLLKDSNKPIGMCGLVKRDYLENVDIGFALMPEYEGLGYGFEMASATIMHSKNILKIDSVVAITDADNASSIKLLNKLGLHFERKVNSAEGDEVLLFS
jgi:RimJ/RimL family protein N-acetyltransferase